MLHIWKKHSIHDSTQFIAGSDGMIEMNFDFNSMPRIQEVLLVGLVQAWGIYAYALENQLVGIGRHFCDQKWSIDSPLGCCWGLERFSVSIKLLIAFLKSCSQNQDVFFVF